MRFTIETSWLFAVLCLLLGAAYAATLYFVGRGAARRGEDSGAFSKRTRRVLGILRCLSVAAIAFLLLSPMVRHESHENQKPIVVIAEDNSSSLLYGNDSVFLRGDYAKAMDEVEKQLRKDCDVQRFVYGGSVKALEQGTSPTYGDKATDMGAMLQAVYERYAGRNLCAVLLSGDGLFNQGLNPLNVAQGATCPIYAVALGDTTARRDAAITHVQCNAVAYLGNDFPVEIHVKAMRLKGQSSTLTVTQEGRTLYEKSLSYDDEAFGATLQLSLHADKPGLRQYTIKLAPCEGEGTIRNNVRTFSVEVVDGQRKIVILSAAPHPDVAALKRAIENRRGYTVETSLARDWKGSFEGYDLVVLHQIPAQGGLGAEAAQQAMKAQKPLLFILGEKSDLARLGALRAGLEVVPKASGPTEAAAAYNDDFSAFSLDDRTTRAIEALPPLNSTFGIYRLAGAMQPLFFAKVGHVKSTQPLLAAGTLQGRRIAFVTGEGIWRWRMADYQQNGNSEVFDELVAKLVAYVTLQPGGERFRVRTKRIWRVGEHVAFEADLYNESFQPVNHPEATLEIRGNGLKRSYKFNKVAQGYQLNVGGLGPGIYTYSASAVLGKENLSAKGSFLVEDINLEDMNLVADHALLNTLATETGGKLLSTEQLKDFPHMLKQRGDMVPLIHTSQRYRELLNLPLAFVIIMLLLSVEWAIRKYNGEP
ncbi:MAG: hypothetical protein SPJ13_05140 [Bacteroidales bacterium]|nr:hypothetical protein [Bacteroidales bacterium]